MSHRFIRPIALGKRERSRLWFLGWVAASSGFIGASLAAVLLQDGLPTYVVDLPHTARSQPMAESIWLRPTIPKPTTLPAICSFVREPRGLRSLDLPYTRSTTGSLYLDPLATAAAGHMIVVIGKTLPSCRIIAWLGSISGTEGMLFRSVMKLAGLQVLRLSPRI